MSELTRFRDHCRKMAKADHRLDCDARKSRLIGWNLASDGMALRFQLNPEPPCAGCLTDADRAMFARLAGEIEDYLSREEDEPVAPTVDDVPLFGATT